MFGCPQKADISFKASYSKKCKENYSNEMNGKICINEKEMVNKEKCTVFKSKNAK